MAELINSGVETNITSVNLPPRISLGNDHKRLKPLAEESKMIGKAVSYEVKDSVRLKNRMKIGRISKSSSAQSRRS
ncbi:MAG: hypothetical protein M1820_007337 [Bogoriella megaspora]|nr:MAG: hypothetical protein M1820_007337 [Bogoriella megaspora]